MPTDAEHFAAAARNQKLLDRLTPMVSEFPEWVAVVAFYKAVHLVEAVFFHNLPEKHTYKHEQREDTLKGNRRYSHIYKHYRPLFQASLVARYLSVGGDDYPRFADYLAADQVVPKLVNHYLNQVEQSVATLLGTWPASVPRCVSPPSRK